MFHRRMTVRARPLVPVLAAAVVALTLAGCQADTSAEGASAGSGEEARPSVVAPGRPGEAAETLSAEEAEKAVSDDSPNSADFRYVRMMIVHHGQALEMTGLAAEHAGSRSVERLADRIAAAQGPEIRAMEGWLDQQDEKQAGGAGQGHEHGSMPGMATEQQLEQLAAARGGAFDELFLKLMVTHHQGAVTMATEALSEGNNGLVGEMATDVIAQQTAEIGRMRGL